MGRFRANYDLDTLRGDVFRAVTCMVVALQAALGCGIVRGWTRPPASIELSRSVSSHRCYSVVSCDRA